MKSRVCQLYVVLSLLMFLHGYNASQIGDLLGQKLVDFANNGLGWQAFQDYLDNEVTFTREPLDASALAQRIAVSMSEKLQIRMTALRTLQQKLQELYSSQYITSHNPFTDCCYVPLHERDKLLNTEVNYDDICTVGQGVSSATKFLPTELNDVIKEQYQKALGIKYAFFGTEEGFLYNYPSLRVCSNSYDPRFRPWYVETSTPEPKDVVIVIDRSGSMTNVHDARSLMDIAKEAALTVLNTMNPNDRVGIVAFSNTVRTPSGTVYTSTCYRTELAKASSQNKEYLRDFISSLSASGGTKYTKGLDSAFDYFANSPDISIEAVKRDQVILFLTDGEPTENVEGIYQKIKDRNKEFNNAIVILTYGLGEKLNQNSAGAILRNMAYQINNDQADGEVTAGIYTAVTNPNNLRADMGSYYDFFLKDAVTDPVFSIPYLDAFGTGLLISMCLPVTSFDTLEGVTCMDLSVDDMLSDIEYFREGSSSYAFIIDSSARILTHPLLPSPSEITNNPYFIYIDSLEPISRIDELSQSMRSGQNGSMEQTSLQVVSRGDVQLEGVYWSHIQSNYSWHPIKGTSFSICIVVRDGDYKTEINWDTEYPDYTYHRLDLSSEPLDTCAMFNRVALKDDSSVTFAARAFKDPFVYLYTDETSSTLDEYETYLRGFTEVNPGFKEGIRESLAVTDFFDNFMANRDHGYELNVAWSYVSTDNGVHRNYPGVEIPKNYDALLRGWNLRSRAHKGQVTVSTPYIDAFGAGTVVTLSKALYEGAPGGTHDKILAVLGIDFTIQYFFNLMTESIDVCNEYDCMVIDNAGLIISHKDWETPLAGETRDTSNIHLAKYEPFLASQLIKEGFMRPEGCVNLVELRDQYVWLISLPSFYSGRFTNRYLEIHNISNTNLFLLVKKYSSLDSCHSCDYAYSECPYNRASSQSCYCQCFVKADIYRYCEAIFDFSSDTLPPCTPPIPSVSFTEVNNKDVLRKEGLSACTNYNCGSSDKTSPGKCSSVLTCGWCAYYKDGTPLESPNCTVSDFCPGGNLPYSKGNDSDNSGASHSLWWVGIIVAVLIVAVVIGILCHKHKPKKGVPGCNRNSGQSNNASRENQANSNNETNRATLSQTNSNVYLVPRTTNVSFSQVTPREPPAYMEIESVAANTPFEDNNFPRHPPPAYGKVYR